MGEISLGNLYDINKTLMAKESKLSKPALANKTKKIKAFFKDNKEYFMLLCHDQHDYTVFKIANKTEETLDKASNELKECLFNRGEILAIDKQDINSIEIWIRSSTTQEIFCYYLFPYDEAIIEVK